MNSYFSKTNFFLYILKFQLLRLKLRLYRTIQFLIELLIRKWLIKNQSLLNFFKESHPNFILQKNAFLKNSKDKKIIFFTFRTLHFIDWVAPIHLALNKNFPDRYEIFYIDFSTTLHRIGMGFEYLRFRKQVEERLLKLNINHLSHFSNEEISDYPYFPEPDVLITCESIRQDIFSINDRIYIPHYILPKANELELPKNIKFNHVFLPTKPPYTYKLLKSKLNPKTKIHWVGYPKLFTESTQINCFPNSKLPIVLYAPSLELKLIFEAIEKGILKVFKEIKMCNFLIKLHPSLGSRRHYISNFFHEMFEFEENIRIDDISGIQSLATQSSIMIADFGSMACEYKLRFGKRVIFLKIPKKYEGGADLIFRDNFADSICEVEDLKETISSLLKRGDLTFEELEKIRRQVLSYTGESDNKAANCINEICSLK